MLLLLLILLVVHQSLALQGHSSASDRPNVTNHVIQQPLDHFNEKDNRTWKMWYYERLDFWKPGGPVFVVTSSPRHTAQGRNLIDNQTLFYVDLAASLNAALINAEARYTGKCEIPNVNMTSFEYMTTKQSLADLARLVTALKARPEFSTSKVVMMGPSYAGTLAVRFRMKHPELADAAYASGAPLLAKKSVPNFYKYADEDLRLPDRFRNCYDDNTEHYKRFDEDMKTTAKKWIMQHALAKIQICNGTDMTDKNNLRSLMYEIVFHQSQYFVFGTPLFYCENFYPRNSIGFQSNVSNYCYDIKWTTTVMDFLKPFHLKDRARLYPNCRDFGHFLLPTDGYHFFGRSGRLAYEFQLMLCLLLFGIEESDIDGYIKETNEEFGGLEPNVSRVILVSGERAANRDLFVRKDLPNDVRTRVIPGAYAYDDSDLIFHTTQPELLEARDWVTKTLKSWM